MVDGVPSIQITDAQNADANSISAPRDDGSTSHLVDRVESTEDASSVVDSAQVRARNAANEVSQQSDGILPAHNTPERRDSDPVMDPLSEQILRRTNASMVPVQRTTSDLENGSSQVPSVAGKEQTDGARGEGPGIPSRDKRKGVSFLSRFKSKRKEVSEKSSGQDPESRDERPEGTDAELFYQPLDNIGFSPQHPQPPGYIKVQSHNKKEKEFDRLFLAQELRGTQDTLTSRNSSTGNLSNSRRKRTTNTEAIWVMEFSKDGKYLAAAGQDKFVRVWAVLSSPEERRLHEKAEEAGGQVNGKGLRLSAPVFRSEPVREYGGHTAAVLDLTWSKNNFLLSSSMDKTVRLWHVTRTECLCAFKHSDIVTSVQFHPRDDRFFLAGSLDSKLRLWSIPDKSVAFWNQVPEMITAVAFTPDGKTAIAGCLTGVCLFFDTEGMKYQTQIFVKSTHGKNAKGSKITGIQTGSLTPGKGIGDIKLLITSNDSRIRLYNMRDKSLEGKFKGNQNTSSQIQARFSEDARYIICGSEDNKAFIWSTANSDIDKNKRPAEFFDANRSATTVALSAPRKTKRLLSNSEDPIYDLCNPPPVILVSRAEVESSYSSQGPTETGSVQPTPATAEGGGTFKRAEHSPAYLARMAHPDGNIIVTASSDGVIKVFRQDCAHDKRQGDDGASIFSKKVGSTLIRKSSMPGRVAGRSRQNSISTQPGVDRVLSWRQGIDSASSFERASSPYLQQVNNGVGSSINRNARSSSPGKKSVSEHFTRHVSGPHRTGKPTSVRTDSNDSPSLGQHSLETDSIKSQKRRRSVLPSLGIVSEPERTTPSTLTSTSESTTSPQGPTTNNLSTPQRPTYETQNSEVYWRRDAWREQISDHLQAAKLNNSPSKSSPQSKLASPDMTPNGGLEATSRGPSQHLEAPTLRRGNTSVSALSSELSSSASNEPSDAESEAPGDTSKSGLKCKKCGSESFKLKAASGGGGGGGGGGGLLSSVLGTRAGGELKWACRRCETFAA